MNEKYDDTHSWELDQEERAIFFDEKANEFKLKEVISDLKSVKSYEYEWDLEKLNISSDAWKIIIHSELRPVDVFCHPEVVVQNKYFVIYFQFLAMLSGKSLSHLGFSSGYGSRYKELKKNKTSALEYAKRINRIVSTMIENRPGRRIDQEILLIWRSMQAGSTSGGSWRNRKGDLEEIRLKRRVFKELQNRGYISSEEEYGKAFGYSVKLKDTGYRLRFSHEPDIGIKKENEDKYEIVVEIKGGIDPAGILERFGATLKSFQKELSKNPNLITLLTLQRAAYTKEAKRRIEVSKEIHKEILINGLEENDYQKAAKKLVDNFEKELSLDSLTSALQA